MALKHIPEEFRYWEDAITKLHFYNSGNLNVQTHFDLKGCHYVPYDKNQSYQLLLELVISLHPEKTPIGVIDEIRRNTPQYVIFDEVPNEILPNEAYKETQIRCFLIYLYQRHTEILTLGEIRLLGTLLGAKYVEGSMLNGQRRILYCWKSPLSLENMCYGREEWKTVHNRLDDTRFVKPKEPNDRWIINNIFFPEDQKRFDAAGLDSLRDSVSVNEDVKRVY